jgi:hypothetical protein
LKERENYRQVPLKPFRFARPPAEASAVGAGREELEIIVRDREAAVEAVREEEDDEIIVGFL